MAENPRSRGSESPLQRFDIDPAISQASTPPAQFYVDDSWFRRVTDAVLKRSWHYLGFSAGLEEVGSVRPVTLLPGVSDEELLLVRGADGVLRLLSNVCTHRGMLVAEKEECVPSLRCRYHGRRFGLDGTFTSMPKFDKVANFPSDQDHLTSFPVAERLGMLFGSLDPESPFEEWFEPVAERLQGIDWGQLSEAEERHKDYEFEGNWMLYLDNYLEGFHIPFIHPGLTAAIAMDQYATHLLPLGTLQVAIARSDDETAFQPTGSHPDAGRSIAAWYFWLFPATLINIYPWGISLNRVDPLNPTRSCVRFRSLVGNRDLLESGAGGDLHQVEMEDEEVVIATQRGLRGTAYHRGRYSPDEEEGVHHFHRLLVARLFRSD